jgi:hypothetical protein
VITLLTPQTFIELIKDTTVHEFKLARILARGSWILSETIPKQFQEDIKKWYLRYEKDGWIKINRLLIRTYCNVCKSFMPKLTVHQKQRLGPWRHPELASRAMQFVFALYITHLDVLHS